MKMKTLTAIAMVALLGSLSANATVIFNDVFDGGEAGPDDLNQNLVARQAGGTTSSTYTLTGTNSASTEILSGAALSSIPSPSNGDYALVDLDTDFGTSLAGNTWSISYDGNFDNSGTGSFGGWAGIFIGNSKGFGTEFGLFFRPDGTSFVFIDGVHMGGGFALPGLGDYRVEATFNEVLNTVSIFHISSGGGTNHLGSYALTFAGGSRYVQFRSHVDSADAGAVVDNHFDNVTIETLPTPPVQAYVFHDTFDTSDTTDFNADLESRQAGGDRLSGYYSWEPTTFTISGNKLQTTGGGLRSVTSFADQIVGNDFIYSFKLTMSPDATSWVGIYLNDANQAGWVEASFGVRCVGIGEGWAFWINNLASLDPVGLTGVGVDEVSSILGYTYDHTQENTIQLVSTAGVDGTNSYDFVLNGVVIRSGMLYTHSEDTGRRILVQDIGGPGDHFIDDFAVELIQGISYEDWVVEDTGLDVGVNDDRMDDPDTDSMENLLEYALGGDPLVDDAAIFLPTSSGAVEVGGTNYLNYVYRRRVDALQRGLVYGVNFKFNLVTDPWTDGGSSFETSAGPIDAFFESVTNEIPTVHSPEGFIVLKVAD